MADLRTCTYLDPHNTQRCTECSSTVDLCQCVNVDGRAQERLTSPEGLVMKMVWDAVDSRRKVDPTRIHALAGLMHASGDLARSAIQHDLQMGTPVQEVLRDAVEVAARAVRLAVEGDDNFLYEFPAVEEDLPRGPVADRY